MTPASRFYPRTDPRCPALTSFSPQRIYDSTGAVVEEQQVGRYYYHAAHAHYHFENWGLYELWTRADWDRYEAGGRAEPIASDTVTSEPRSIGSKTTSCVMDEEFIRSLPGTPWPPAFPSSYPTPATRAFQRR